MRIIALALLLFLMVGCTAKAPDKEEAATNNDLPPQEEEKKEDYWEKIGLHETVPVDKENQIITPGLTVEDFQRLNAYPREKEAPPDIFYVGEEEGYTEFRSYEELLEEDPHMPSFIARVARRTPDLLPEYKAMGYEVEFAAFVTIPELTYISNEGHYVARGREWFILPEESPDFKPETVYWRDAEMHFRFGIGREAHLMDTVHFTQPELIDAEQFIREFEGAYQ
jgi:hypothetical protein